MKWQETYFGAGESADSCGRSRIAILWASENPSIRKPKHQKTQASENPSIRKPKHQKTQASENPSIRKPKHQKTQASENPRPTLPPRGWGTQPFYFAMNCYSGILTNNVAPNQLPEFRKGHPPYVEDVSTIDAVPSKGAQGP